MSYIDTEELKNLIEAKYKEYVGMSKQTHDSLQYKYIADGLDIAEQLIDSLQQEQPEYGYSFTMYIDGKKARWNVGDTIAYYLCTSNEEGEIIIGKITKVDFNDEEGWVYTFENEDMWDEQSLYENEAYKKN